MGYNDIKKCTKCGAEYEIGKIKYPVRDKDSIECDICGTKLISWNGSTAYTAKLIKKGN
jgi:DNA-directed RNA polymerase subunit RPC12/RpoP